MVREEWKNKLYFGDNLAILREHIPDESVDLIYLDPPFNSKATYNVLFSEKNGTQSAAQITAFEDTWHWGMESEAAYHEIVTGGGKLADLVGALRQFLGSNDMMAYLTMMAIRLQEMHRVLQDTGSLYLHCDPTASHYLKLVMDAVFGPVSFKNEISWRRSHPRGQASTRFGSNHDVLLFYVKDASKACWNPPYMTYDPVKAAQQYSVTDDDGRRYQLTSLLNPNPNRPNLTYEFMGVTKVWRWTRKRMEAEAAKGRIIVPRGGKGIPRYKRYLDEQKGVPVDDFWGDIKIANGLERLGYPTQKPEALLERIIKASSNAGDVVLDPFCGCGTAIAVAERLHRRWVGIDITHLAIALMKHRLHDTFVDELSPYEVIGDPKDLGGACALAQEDRYQFEWWALSLVDAQPAQDKKKGADKGIDGLIYFIDNAEGKLKRILVQVKSGHVMRSQVSDLCHAVDRENAAIGLFITLEEPTRPMIEEAATASFYEAKELGKKYPRLQILTIEELLNGKQSEYPRGAGRLTYKQAQRRRKQAAAQPSLLDE